jgi:hypothetical protein
MEFTPAGQLAFSHSLGCFWDDSPAPGIGDAGIGDGGATRIFDRAERLQALSAAGDPLERLSAVINIEVFRGDLETALSRSDRSKGGATTL